MNHFFGSRVTGTMALISRNSGSTSPERWLNLVRNTHLRQLACSTALLGGKDYSAKADALEELLETHAEYHEFIIFSNFREFVKILAGRLAKYKPAVVMGGMKDADRVNEIKRRFIGDDTCRILLCTIDAAGEGLNLQIADRIVFTDLPWVPKAINQCIGSKT